MMNQEGHILFDCGCRADKKGVLWSLTHCTSSQDAKELQRKRMRAATKRYQNAHRNHTTFPDLGTLLDWMLGEMDKATPEPVAAEGG